MILAYDFGTGGIKAALFDTNGVCVRDAFSGYETLYPAPLCHEQRPEDWWNAVIASTRSLGDVSEVTAIGISGHSLGVVPLDAQGKLLRDTVPIWSDARAEAEAKIFFNTPGAPTEAAWYTETGCGFPPALYSIFKLMWFQRHESEWFEQTDIILGTKDWINYKLTGAYAIDPSYASGTGVYDLSHRCYDEDLIRLSGVPRSLFPKIVPSTQVVGTILPQVAELLGLPANVQVVAGGVDNSCMALGAGAYRNGEAYASLGSSAWVAVSGDKPVLNVKSRPYVFEHVVPGQYASALAIFSAGTCFSWLRSMLGLDYATLDALAEEAGAGAHGLLFNPSLAGGSSLDVTPRMRGAFAHLELGHTRGDMARAVLEGVAQGLKVALDELAKQVPLTEPLMLVGGGAKSQLWRQIYADVFGKAVVRNPIGQQCAALGAAVLAGIGTGVWSDFNVMQDILAQSGMAKPETPNPTNKALYAQQTQQFLSLMQMLGKWTEGIRN